jgi:Zn-dependent metalloprotease
MEGMGYRVHEKDGFVRSANGKAVRDIEVDTNIILTEEEAFSLAKKYLNAKDTTFTGGKRLIVSKGFTFAPESFFVAFQFDIDISLIERWRISIDAHAGEVINKVSLVNSCLKEITPPLPYGTGTGRTNYYGNKTIRIEKLDGGASKMTGRTENGGMINTKDYHNVSIIPLLLGFPFTVYDFYSSSGNYYNSYDAPAVSVQWAAEQAYEYYFTKHGRNSFDNLGGTITSYVHVDVKLNNAYWTGKLLAFGDGSADNPLVELDVVSHELTHGVTQYEAKLQYYNESGALNESFSDILGKAIEFHTFGDTATWQLAKHYRDGGLRDFSNPNLKDQPDTYMGNMWYTGSEDSGGVHYNSGVQNFWFYLLCEGGSGVNDQEVDYSVQSIGIETAANIVYRNLTEYLDVTSDYLDSRIGSLLAAADLHGKNSVIYQEVANAWDAVGVIDEPIITSLELFDITATTVKVKGSFAPRGDTVSYHFEYGTTPDFENSSAIYEYKGTVEGIVTGLQSETMYYLRLVATNENGNSYEATEFTTLSLAPLVKIRNTVDVTESTATLYGQINPNSLPTSFYFEYGLTPDLGLVTPLYPLSDTTEFVNVSAPVAGLERRKAYYYRLVATNGFSSSSTEAVNFFTAVKPVISGYTPATAAPGAEVTIAGSNFNSTPDKNVVSFGATRATVLTSSTTELKVTVPAGASLAPVSLLDVESGLTALSVREFVPTYSGEFTKSSLKLTVGIRDANLSRPMVQDMDGDNRPDIVGGGSPGFLIYQNVNQGGDVTVESFIRNTYPVELSGELFLIDFDGNGFKDVVGRYTAGIRIFPNLSVPGFIFFGAPVDVPFGASGNLVFNDFDQDGHIDIVTRRSIAGDSTQIRIIRNQNPKGILSSDNFVLQYELGVPFYATELYTADLNNDGKPDLICGIPDKKYVAVLQNNSHDGILSFEEVFAPDLTRARFAYYLSKDLNQDGWKDVVSYSQSGDVNLHVLQNTGTSPIISLGTPVPVLKGYADSRVSQAGDINGDGKVDLLTGINNRKFILLKNKAVAGELLSTTSFEIFETFTSVGTTDSKQSSIATNDLNGDGRPEVIVTNSFNQFPYEGYQLEIWQNGPLNCVDPTLVTVSVSNHTATIALPPGTTMDHFQMEYRQASGSQWTTISSTTRELTVGVAYQLRVRAYCYFGFSDYHYVNFAAECVDANSFSVTNITINSVQINGFNFFEVHYSKAGQNVWTIVPQGNFQISNLEVGTTYDVRFRGRCAPSGNFYYKQFTTLCPNLSALTIDNLFYNSARVNFTSSYTGNVTLEYSTDNVNWISIDQSGNLTGLSPVRKYFVRGQLACNNSNSDFIFTSFTTPCSTVSMLSAEETTPFSTTIEWIDELETGNYTVVYFADGGVRVTTVETNATSFTLDGLSPGTQYTVSVAPQCTMEKAFKTVTFSTACYVPFDLSADAITQTTADLSWSDQFNAVPFSIDYSISGSNVWLTTETASTNMTLVDLRPGTEYEARVHINCPAETAPFVSVHFETGFYGEATVAPNPTESQVTIYPASNLIGYRFSLHDNMGRAVTQGRIIDYVLDLSTLPPGVYTLKIAGNKPFRIIKK